MDQKTFQPAGETKRRDYQPHPLARHPENWKVLDGIRWDEPLVVEVGCGTGEWIIAEASRRPGDQFVAIEKTKNRSDTLLMRVDSAPLTNLIVLRADAVAVLANCFPTESVDEFYFLHPNPWPKKRQANRRFFVSPSFSVFDRCLKPGGKIELASNTTEYVDEAADCLTRLWGYHLIAHHPLPVKAPPRTAFERKYLARGEIIYQLVAQKGA